MRTFLSRRVRIAVTILLLLVSAFSVYVLPARAQQFTQTINYQGKLVNASSVAVADGATTMTFKLYTAATGGTLLWTETQAATTTSGLFSVMLGASTTLATVNFNQALYLGVTVGADSEMSPRKILGTVPAAFEAKNAQTVGGVASTSLVRSDVAGSISASSTASALMSFIQTGPGKLFTLFSGAYEALTVDNTGNVGIGSSTPSTKLSVAGNAYIGGNLTATGTVAITGAATLSSTLGVTGATTFSSLLSVVGTSTFATTTAASSSVLTLNVGNNATINGTLTSGAINGQTISNVASFTGTVNAVTGYKVNGAATTGNVLRGDGTNFVSATLAGGDITGAALTETDDTNVTLTLGGTPATSLLRAASITVGWTGTLAATRGGTGRTGFGGLNTILYTNATNSLATSTTFTFDGTTLVAPGFTTAAGSTTISGTSAHTGAASFASTLGVTGLATFGNASSSILSATTFFASSSSIPTLNVGTLGTINTLASANATIGTLTLTNQLTVANGGTGAITLGAGQVLVGNGTGAITSTTTANLKASMLLNNVENTALSTWAGSTNLTTLGTITSGTWNGTTIAAANGGTGRTGFGGLNTILYTNATNSLATSTTFTFNGTTFVAPGFTAAAGSTTISGTLAVAGSATFTADVNASGGLFTAGGVNTTYLPSGAGTWAYYGASTASTIYSSNYSSLDGTGSFYSPSVRNTNGNVQTGYIGVVSVTGAANYIPAVVFGQQTGSSSYSESMRLSERGYLGIGTSTPTSLLSVASSTATGASSLFSVAAASNVFSVLANGNTSIVGGVFASSTLGVTGVTQLFGHAILTSATLASSTLASTTIARMNVGSSSIVSFTGAGLTVSGAGFLTVNTASLGLGNGSFIGLSDTPSSFGANRIIYTNSTSSALRDNATFTFDGTTLVAPGFTTAAGSTTISGTSAHTGAASFVSTLGVTGLATFGNASSSVLTATTFFSGSSSIGTLNVSGNQILNGTLTSGAINGQTISSAASFTGTLAVTGATTLSSTLSVIATSTFATTTAASSSVGTLNAITANVGTLNLTNGLSDASVSDILTISGGTIGSNNISGTLTTTGTLTIGDNGDNIVFDSNIWDISGAGVGSGFTGFTTTGTLSAAIGTFSGTVAVSGTSTFATTTAASSSVGTLNVSGVSTHTGLATFGNASSSVLTATALYSTTATTSQQAITSLTNTGIVYALANGRLADSANLTFNGTTLTAAAGTTLALNSTGLSIADTDIAFNGVSTNFNMTGDFSVNTNNLSVNKARGFVGIGTNNPFYLLELATSSEGTVSTFHYNGATAGGASIKVTNGYSATEPIYSFWYNGATGIGNPGTNTTSFIQGNTEAMRISGNGNVSIGTTSSSSVLNVAGSVAFVGVTNINTSGSADTNIGNSNVASNLNFMSGNTSVFDVATSTANAYRLRVGSTAYYALDTRPSTINVAAHTFTAAAPTIARNGNANRFSLAEFTPAVVTWTGSTGMTDATAASSNKSVYFDQPTIAWATASNTTIANASNMVINGGTQALNNSGSSTVALTITNSSALRIFAGAALSSTTSSIVTNGYGLYVDAPTGATNNYAALFNGTSTFSGGLVTLGNASSTVLSAATLYAGTLSGHTLLSSATLASSTLASTTITTANIGTLNLVNDLTVANGGTGASTLTGLLQGNGTGAITGVTGTAGQFAYYSGTNVISATSSLYMATNGNVGIGTSAPGALFTVYSTASSADSGLRIVNGLTSDKVNFYYTDLLASSTFNINYANTGGTNIAITGTGDVFLNPTNDNVTVGSSTADTKFSVYQSTDGSNTGGISLFNTLGNRANFFMGNGNNLTLNVGNAGNGDMYFEPTGTGSFSIGTTSTTSRLNVAGTVKITGLTTLAEIVGSGTSIASVATASGTTATDLMTMTAATGGNTTISTSAGTGGVGGDIRFTMGVGGVASAAATSSFGGAGGQFVLTGGVGGAATVAGSGINTGGAGGAYSLTAGTGGAASLGTTNTGGVGGAFTLTAGTGGVGATTGGNGGLMTVSGGTAAAATSSTGGGLTLKAAAGSSIGSGGNGGAIIITGGAAGGDDSASRTGGAVTITAGIAKGSSAGGAITLTAGNSGASSTGAGGAMNFYPGDGGTNTNIGTSTGPNGGASTLSLGTGGTAPNATVLSTGGAGGTYSLTGGAGGAAGVGGAVNNTGGAGSLFNLIAGTGGAASGVTSGTNTGGAGGAITIRPGTGGAATAGSGSLAGGTGGLLTLQGGTGGAGVTTPGVGGGVAIVGGTGATNSTGGDVTLKGGIATTGTGGNIIFQTAAVSTLSTRMTITNAGLVGIGTTTPNAQLTVHGDINISNTSQGYKIMGNRILYASSSNNSIFVGINAGSSNVAAGSNNTAIGTDALAGVGSASYNTAVGYQALTANSGGQDNTAIGRISLAANVTGAFNTALGSNSMLGNIAGSGNTAAGLSSLQANTYGSENTALGDGAMYFNTGGSFNVAVGQNALQSNLKGDYNTAIGVGAGASIGTATTTGYNTVIGANTAQNLTTGKENTIIGAQINSGNLSNNIIIGDGAGTQRINVDNLGNSTLTLNNNGATAFRLLSGAAGTAYYTLNTQAASSNVTAHTFTSDLATFGSGANVRYVTAAFSPATTTFTGTTNITNSTVANSNKSVYFDQPGLQWTDASARTITTASNVVINGAPQVANGTNGGSLTLTNAYALRIYAGAGLPASTSATVTNGYGLYVDAPTGAANNFAAYFSGTSSFVGNVGIGTTSPAYALAVSGDVNVTGFFRTNGDAGAAGQVLLATATGTRWATASSGSLTFSNGLTRTVDDIALGGTLTLPTTTIDAAAAATLSLTSTLTAAGRTSFPLSISQANDATNNNTVGLMQLTNADSGSTAALLNITQVAAGAGISFTGLTTGTSMTVANTSGTAINANTITSGTGLTATGLTSGSALTGGLANAATTASVVRIVNAAAAVTGSYSGAIIDISPTRTVSTAVSVADTGNYLRVQRAYTTSNAGATSTISGDLVKFTSNCTRTSGACIDTASVLTASQLYASSTGPVMNVSGTGYGNVGYFLAASSTFTANVLRLAANAGPGGITANYNFIEAVSDEDGTPATQFVVNSNGNMGLGTGVVPQPLFGTNIQINNNSIHSGPAAIYGIGIMNNVYPATDGGYKNRLEGVGAGYFMASGTHSFAISASGAADATVAWSYPLKIQSDGNIIISGSSKLGIGTTTPFYAFDLNDATSTSYVAQIRNTSAGNTSDGLLIQIGDSTLTSNNEYIAFASATGTVLGNIVNSGGTMLYANVSDARLKENIATSTFGLSSLLAVDVVDYTFKNNPGMLQNGFLAQQLYTKYPFAVSRPETEEGTWAVDYGKLTPLIVKSLQDGHTSLVELLTVGTTTLGSDLFGNINSGAEDTVWEKLVAMAKGFTNGVLQLAGLKADKVETNELCVGATCITESELKDLINQKNAAAAGQSNTRTPEPAPTPTPDPTPTPTPEPVPSPTPEPAPSPEPAPAPAPAPDPTPTPEPAPSPAV